MQSHSFVRAHLACRTWEERLPPLSDLVLGLTEEAGHADEQQE